MRWRIVKYEDHPRSDAVQIQLWFCKYILECGFPGSLLPGDKIILNAYSA